VPDPTPEIERRLLRRAGEHHGLISGPDALRSGFTQSQIDRRVAQGRWERVHPGVFRVAGSPETELQLLAAAALWTGGAASHLSAGALLDLTPVAARPHLIVDRDSSARRVGVVVHRIGDVLRSDLTSLHGIPCTNATRTCIDLGAILSEPQLERVVDRALHRGLTHVDRLVARFLQLARRGRPGTARLRSVLRRIDPALAPPESDGFAHHGHREAFERDRFRQNLLVLAGWRVLRFTWRQICTDPDGVAEQVAAALAVRP